MNTGIEKIFPMHRKLNKKALILVFTCFVVLGLFLPLWPAYALFEGIVQAILEGIISIFIKIIVLSFALWLFISALFVGFIGLILGWIISPDFISLKFTQNPFVDLGLNISKGFANMGFIIFLVAIALATILRIEEYKAKKTLPTLILVALLVNFSPVLCGIIIDASNIVMGFFLRNILGFDGFFNFINAASQIFYQAIIGSGFDLWANIAALMQVLVMIVFNFFAGFILVLFCALFIMRYIMLWILVIVSPVAFVSYILPVTRRGGSILSWKEWWKQLIAWSVIGVIAGFFLYLGFAMIAFTAANPGMFVSHPTIGQLGLMNNVLPYLIPLVLLWIAYKETKRTSAMLASEIVAIPEKVTKAAVMAGATMATGMAVGVAGKALSRAIPERTKRWGERQTAAPTWGANVPGIKGYAMRTVGAPFGYVRRKIGQAVSYVPSIEKEDVKKAESAADKRDVFGNLTALREAKNHSDMLGVLKKMIQKKQIKDATDKNIVGAGGVIGNEEVLKAYKKAREYRDKDAIEDIETSFAHLAGRFAKIVDEETKKYAAPAPGQLDQRTGYVDPATGTRYSGLNEEDVTVKKYTSYEDKIMAGIKTAQDVEKLPKNWHENSALLASAEKFWTGSQMGKAAERFGGEFVEKFMAGIESHIHDIEVTRNLTHDEAIEEYIRARPKIALYLSGNAAQDLGFKSPGNKTRRQIQNILQ